jgi:hypothetical protein
VHKEQRVTTAGGHAHTQKPPNAPDTPDAPDAPQDGGAPPESATKRQTVDEYMKSKEREETEDKKRRDAWLAKMSNGRLSYVKKSADISHLLRQLQLYST